jgi:hypothetical protein
MCSCYRSYLAYRVDRGKALCFLDLGARRGWAVSTTLRPLYPRERPGTHCNFVRKVNEKVRDDRRFTNSDLSLHFPRISRTLICDVVSSHLGSGQHRRWPHSMRRVHKNLCPAMISASIMAESMWKNSLKNVECDNNQILYETLLNFFTVKRYLLSE